MKLLFGYEYDTENITTTAAYFYKKALRKKAKVITFGPSKDKASLQDIPCSYTVNILPIIEKIKPDYLILYPEGNKFFLPQNIDKVKIPKILLVTDLLFINHWMRYYTGFFDFVFSASDKYMKSLERSGSLLDWLPVACDPDIHKDYHLKRTYDISFVGNMQNWYYPKRSFYLNSLKQNFDLKIFTGVYLEKMSKIYSRSKIVFNMSISSELNMRFFEAMSCGSMLLTDVLPSKLYKLFPANSFVSYHSLNEAIQLVNYYLANSKEREIIAKRGQEIVIKHHTYDRRVEYMLDKITENSFFRNPNRNNANLFLKTYLFINEPDYLIPDTNRIHSNNIYYIISKLPWKWRKRVMRVFGRMNMDAIIGNSKWIYRHISVRLQKIERNIKSKWYKKVFYDKR